MCHNKKWDFGQNSSPVCVKPGCNTAWFQFHLKNYEVKFGENKAIAKIFCHPGHQINGTTKVTHFLKVNTIPPFSLCFTAIYNYFMITYVLQIVIFSMLLFILPTKI